MWMCTWSELVKRWEGFDGNNIYLSEQCIFLNIRFPRCMLTLSSTECLQSSGLAKCGSEDSAGAWSWCIAQRGRAVCMVVPCGSLILCTLRQHFWHYSKVAWRVFFQWPRLGVKTSTRSNIDSDRSSMKSFSSSIRSFTMFFVIMC